MTGSRPARCCRECGLEIPPDAPGGRCSHCLLTLALGSTPDRTEGGEFPTAPPPRRWLGGYELLEEIAQGGMGVVWRARQPGLNRTVALKTLHAGSLASASARVRFRMEVEAVARLSHPNIVALFEAAESEGLHFYTMKLVEGGTLADALANPARRPDLPGLLAKVARVARAIHYAHQRGILHRDLKPSNILIDEGGEPLVADFGLARSLLPEDGFTQSGVILGSPNYMAPEQAFGRPAEISVAADVYSLGAILYEVIAGRPPFVAASPLEVLDLARRTTPAPPGASGDWTRSLPKSSARDLETIVLKCLRKEPAGRYASAGALAEELDRWLAGQPIEARPMGRGERVWHWCRHEPAKASALAALLGLLLTVSAGATLHAWRMDHARRRIADQARTLTEQNTALRLREAETFFERDEAAKAVATLAGLVRADPSNRVAAARLDSALTLRPFGRALFYPLSLPSDPLAIRWTSSGKEILTVTRDGLVRWWSAETGAPLPPDLDLLPGLELVAVSEDGHTLVLARGRQVEWWSLAERRKLREFVHAGRITALRLRPTEADRVLAGDETGKVRLWTAQETKEADAPAVQTEGPVEDVQFADHQGLRLVTVTTSGVLQVWETRGRQPELRWRQQAGSGSSLRAEVNPQRGVIAVAEASKVWLRDLASGEVVGSPILHPARVALLCFNSDGTTLASVSEGVVGHLVRLDPTAGNAPASVLLRQRQAIRAVAFSRDGQRLLLGGDDRTARVYAALDGQPASEPMQHSKGVRWGAFGPDDHRVITATFGSAVWGWRPGEPPAPVTLHLGESVFSTAWDPTGKHVVLGGNSGTVGWWTRTTGWEGGVFSRERGPVWSAEFSRDGRWLAYAHSGGAATVVDVATRARRELRHDGWCWVMNARFDGRGTRVVTAGHDRRAIVWDLESGRSRCVLLHPAEVDDAGFSPDGRQVLTRCKDERARLWEAETGRLVSEGMQHQAWVDAVGFSPDGRWILTGSRDASVRRWSFDEVRLGTARTAHETWFGAGIRLVSMTPHEARFAVVLEDQTVRLVLPGAPGPGAVLPHRDTVFDAQFDPAGSRLVTAAGHDGARLWDVASGQPLSEPLRHAGRVWRARFGPDGDTVLTGGEDGDARLWPTPRSPPRAPDRLADFAETQVVLRGDSSSGFSQQGVLTWEELERKWPTVDPRRRGATGAVRKVESP